jgi:hypothetical protein
MASVKPGKVRTMGNESGRIPRTREDLRGELREQLGLLQTLCELYDQGNTSQAKMIAVIVRTLLHDGGKKSSSRALLAQLGLRRRFVDTAFDVTDDGAQPVWRCRLAVPDTRTSGAWAPILDAPESRTENFFEWWREIVIRDFDENGFSRKDLILNVADTDGGAHVDPTLERTYARLTRENSCQMLVGPTGSSGGFPEKIERDQLRPMESPVNASIRQIGHEVLKTLVSGYDYQTDAYAPGVAIVGLVIEPQAGTAVDAKDKTGE